MFRRDAEGWLLSLRWRRWSMDLWVWSHPGIRIHPQVRSEPWGPGLRRWSLATRWALVCVWRELPGCEAPQVPF